MKEILADIDRWFAEGETAVAVATVVMTWGSAPRRVGAKMAVTADGRISGSVSGGCVEGAVVVSASQTLETGEPQLLHFGVADDTAWDVGLACGGNIEVFVEKMEQDWYRFLLHAEKEGWAGVVATVIDGNAAPTRRKAAYDSGGLRHGILGAKEESELLGLMPDLLKSQRLTLETGSEVFVDVFRPDPVLVAVGGVHIAIALTREAKHLGFQTVVIDPRRAFGNATRFPEVDRLIQKWPQEAFEIVRPSYNMAVALLTHDPKIDDQALEILLKSDIFYIGALGSHKTHRKRVDRLVKMGFEEAKIGRIFAPIGLDIGAENPEEIALSIMAEIVAVQRGRNWDD
jgi:xanthine dehydrogenase accessory factor